MWEGVRYRKSDQIRKAKGIKQEGAGRSINIHGRTKKVYNGAGRQIIQKGAGGAKKDETNYTLLC